MYKKLFKFVIVYFTILSITPALTVKASELEADQASQNNSFSELSEDPLRQTRWSMWMTAFPAQISKDRLSEE